MFEKFTEDAIQSIIFAQEEARGLGYNRVGTENILLGIIRAGGAASELEIAGVTLHTRRAAVEKLLGRASQPQQIEMPLTERAKKIIIQSWYESKQIGVGYISSDHLLLAIFSLQEGVAFDVLSNLGADLSALHTVIISRISAQADLSTEPQYLTLEDALKYTAESNEVLHRAAVETLRLGHGYIGTEQILVGLFDDSSVAAKALHSFGLSADPVRTEIGNIIGIGPCSTDPNLGFSPRAKMMLNRASLYTRKLKKEFVSPEHILLALLDESGGVASEIFNAFDVDINELRIKVGELISGS